MLSLKKTIACLALCSGLPACAAFPAVLTNKLGASCAVARMSGIGALRWEPLLMATEQPGTDAFKFELGGAGWSTRVADHGLLGMEVSEGAPGGQAMFRIEDGGGDLIGVLGYSSQAGQDQGTLTLVPIAPGLALIDDVPGGYYLAWEQDRDWILKAIADSKAQPDAAPMPGSGANKHES